VLWFESCPITSTRCEFVNTPYAPFTIFAKHGIIEFVMTLNLNPKLEIKRSPIDGRGLFTLVRFSEGDEFHVVVGHQPSIIMTNPGFKEYVDSHDSWDAIYLGNGTHQVSLVVRDDNPSNFGNHSCDPNTALSVGGRTALRDIDIGKELTVDYTPLSSPDWTMHGNCGSEHCPVPYAECRDQRRRERISHRYRLCITAHGDLYR
jgi:hypothetical protein